MPKGARANEPADSRNEEENLPFAVRQPDIVRKRRNTIVALLVALFLMCCPAMALTACTGGHMTEAEIRERRKAIDERSEETAAQNKVEAYENLKGLVDGIDSDSTYLDETYWEDYSAFDEALANARELLEDENSSSYDLSIAYDRLAEAKDSLVRLTDEAHEVYAQRKAEKDAAEAREEAERRERQAEREKEEAEQAEIDARRSEYKDVSLKEVQRWTHDEAMEKVKVSGVVIAADSTSVIIGNPVVAALSGWDENSVQVNYSPTELGEKLREGDMITAYGTFIAGGSGPIVNSSDVVIDFRI